MQNRKKMKSTIALVAMLVLPGIFVPPAAAEEEGPMLHIAFRYLSPEIEKGSFEATVRKVWRVGDRYLRIEEAPDPKVGLHGLIIVNAPHSYMINRYVDQGVHILDTEPEQRVHYPVFPGNKKSKIGKLEFGNEQEFFKSSGAEALEQQYIEGDLCDVWRLNVDGSTLTLFVGVATERPKQISIESPDTAYSIRYETYERLPEADLGLFVVPDEITIVEAKS